MAKIAERSAGVAVGPRRLRVTAAPLTAEIATIAVTVRTVVRRDRNPLDALGASE
jgi:hypothetical protein